MLKIHLYLFRQEPTASCSEVKNLYWTRNPEASSTYVYFEWAVVSTFIQVIPRKLVLISSSSNYGEDGVRKSPKLTQP